jgi:hypothetical protein
MSTLHHSHITSHRVRLRSRCAAAIAMAVVFAAGGQLARAQAVEPAPAPATEAPSLIFVPSPMVEERSSSAVAALALPEPPASSSFVVAALRSNMGHVLASTDYTPDSDPDQLLGLPGQYVSKTAFVDDRVAPYGGIVEVFGATGDRVARTVTLQKFSQPQSQEYYFGVGVVLLRLSGSLAQAQANDYAAALQAALQQ